MKKLHFFHIPAFICIAAFLSSCSSGTNINPPPGPTARMDFKKGFHANYDLFTVDTADASMNNGDKIISASRMPVSEIVIDTNLKYIGIDIGEGIGFNGVAHIFTYDANNKPIDSQYYYQAPGGDLYRYNFGFSTLNQFSALTSAIGSQVDVGWVLAAKMGSVEGTTWTARIDSVQVQSLNGIWVHLLSQGQMMADTTFLVGTETIKVRHSRNIVTATANLLTSVQNGMVIIDSYYSTDINAVVEDFFRHVTLSGPLLNQQAQGSLKIMTSHN